MPLLRNIAGFNVGLVAEGSGADTMRALDEAGGGGTYQGGDPVYPVNPNPVYYDPVPIRPVEPIEPIYMGPGGDVVTDLPAPNEMPVGDRFLPGGLFTDGVDWIGLLATAGVVLAMTGIHPLKKVGGSVVFGGTLALLLFRLHKAANNPGTVVLTQPNIL